LLSGEMSAARSAAVAVLCRLPSMVVMTANTPVLGRRILIRGNLIG
jgi:hypothetical protein